MKIQRGVLLIRTARLNHTTRALSQLSEVESNSSSNRFRLLKLANIVRPEDVDSHNVAIIPIIVELSRVLKKA